MVFIVWVFLVFSSPALAGGNESIRNFHAAKKLAVRLHKPHPYTIYCNCRYQGNRIDLASCGYQPQSNPKRAARLEWEHVVPAESFGQAFEEWRSGGPKCVRKGRRFKGRKCAETNPLFSKMEGDLYNLWPEVGELNGLRSNYSMAELGAEKSGKGDFGGCKARIRDRKFEPMPSAKGRVARVYLYMDQAYPGHGIISNKNRKLFEAWDKLHPVDEWECARADEILLVQGNENAILMERCHRKDRAPPHENGK